MNGLLELLNRPAMTGVMFGYVLFCPHFKQGSSLLSNSQTMMVQWCKLAGMQVHVMPEYGG
jgi:hypothetical protein